MAPRSGCAASCRMPACGRSSSASPRTPSASSWWWMNWQYPTHEFASKLRDIPAHELHYPSPDRPRLMTATGPPPYRNPKPEGGMVMADNLKDTMKKAGDKVAEKATEAKNWASEKAEEATDWAKQKIHKAQNSAEEAEQKAKNKADENKGDNCGCS